MSAIGGYASSSSYSGYAQSSVRQRPSEEEMAAKKKELFNKADTDGSGGLDKTEFGDLLSKGSGGASSSSNIDDTFTKFDSNSDGGISQDEMDAGMKSMHEQMKSMMHKMKFSKQEQGSDSMPPPPPPDSASTQNGKISSSSDAFSSLDANGDGLIDGGEFSNISSTQVKKVISAYLQQMSSDYSSASYSALSSLSV